MPRTTSNKSVKDCRCGERAGTVDSTSIPNGWRRRYRCLNCGRKWTTLEVRAERHGHTLRTADEQEVRKRVAAELYAVLQEWALQ